MKRRGIACLLVLAVMVLAASAAGAHERAAAPPADPHQQLQEILHRPLYQRWQLRQDRERSEESAVTAAIRQQMQTFREWLESLREFLFRGRRSRGSGGAPGLSAGLVTLFQAIAWIALGLFVIALVVLMVRLIRSGRDKAASGTVLSREQVADALSQGDALALRGDQWFDEAGRLAAEEDFRAMYRALYLGLLSGLHARGKIVFERHHTNWTYVNGYRGESSEREIFSALTDLFDSVWYGLKASRGEDIHTLRRQVESLTGAVPVRGEPRAH